VTYPTLDAILEAKVRALTALEARMEGLSAARQNARPGAGGWSAAEILEHLVLVETQLLRMIASLLKKAEAAGARATGHSYAVDMEALVERSGREKYATREPFQPSGALPAAAALAGLKDLQAELEKLGPRLAAVDPRQSRFPHWIFGPLDLAQWLAFLALHEERHLRQIESLAGSADVHRGE
jgi:hypothetical protein